MKALIPSIFLIFLLSACHQKQGENTMYDAISMEEEIPLTRQEMNSPSAAPLPPLEKQEVIKKKIIKDGRIGLRVTELEKAKSAVDALLKQHAAYYANERFNNNDWESSYSLKIRIPSANFEAFINGIESEDGEVLYKEIDARDVTDQFIDLETRLKNKRHYLERYSDLLNRARSIKEILEIEEKIRGLEEEIESTTGRLKYLSDLVDFSTLDLSISKQKDFKYNPQNRDKFSERFKQSVSKGWNGFVDFTLFVFKIWPFWIILFFILYTWKKYRKRKKKR